MLDSYQAETEGRRCFPCTSGPGVVDEMSETVLEMGADVPAHHGTATPGHCDSCLGLLEHSPSHFREERQRARTLTASAIIVTALSLIPRWPSLTHGAAEFVERECDFSLSDGKRSQY